MKHYVKISLFFIILTFHSVSKAQEIYPLGEGYHWWYEHNGLVREEIIGNNIFNHNGDDYYMIQNFRWDGRSVGLRNDGLKVHILTGLNTTPVDCVLFDFEAEEGESWSYYDADEGWDFIMTLESISDTVVWGDTINPISSPCFRFSTGGIADAGYIEWISYYDLNDEINGHAGIVKRTSISFGGYLDWICSEFYTPLSIDENENPIPQEFKLFQPYPNPFNPTTTIRFNIGVEMQHATSLQIFDITGRLMETLVNEPLTPGEHEITWSAGNLPSGVYFVQLGSDGFSQTQKIILMK